MLTSVLPLWRLTSKKRTFCSSCHPFEGIRFFFETVISWFGVSDERPFPFFFHLLTVGASSPALTRCKLWLDVSGSGIDMLNRKKMHFSFLRRTGTFRLKVMLDFVFLPELTFWWFPWWGKFCCRRCASSPPWSCWRSSEYPGLQGSRWRPPPEPNGHLTAVRRTSRIMETGTFSKGSLSIPDFHLHPIPTWCRSCLSTFSGRSQSSAAEAGPQLSSSRSRAAFWNRTGILDLQFGRRVRLGEMLLVKRWMMKARSKILFAVVCNN